MKIKTALKLGASHVLKNKDFNNYLDCFDYVVECTGNKEMLNFSIKLTVIKNKYIFFGLFYFFVVVIIAD